MTDYASANFTALVSREQAGNSVRDALALFVGRGRRYSVKQLSNATGVKDRVIECALVDPRSVDHRPLPFGAFLSVAKFLGPAFTSEVIRPIGQVAVSVPEGVDYDAIAEWAEGFSAEKLAAHRADSECAEQLGPGEKGRLTARILDFPAAVNG